MSLSFEWDRDIYGKSILLARKSRGKISISELQEEMSRDYRYQGAWAVVFVNKEESYQGWGDIDAPKGDALELYQVADGEECPICAARFIDYCPHCGERVREDV